MTNVASWNVEPAASSQELMDVLFIAAAGLKTQVLASPILAAPSHERLRMRLSAIADELNGLQLNAVLPTKS
jgi:hypothetical protein